MTDETATVVDRDQLEVALELLEWNHGQALRRPWSDEAAAFYEAIKIVEDALDEKFKPDAHLPAEEITRSREAREAGYREATLLDERMTTYSDKTESKRLIDVLRGWFQ